MRIAILSAGTGWHVRDLLRAAGQLGHEAEAVDFRKISAEINGERGTRNEEAKIVIHHSSFIASTLAQANRVIVRTMPPGSLEQVVFRMDALHRLQAEGTPVLNPPGALETCIDKYLATARLAAAGLPVPPTISCQHADAALEAFKALGGDVVVKPLFGSEGRGIIRLTDLDLAWRTFQTIERLQAVIYVQKFIPHYGHDLRAFILAGRVIAAMRRTAKGDWRTNVAQGGVAEAVELGADEEELALEAAKAVNAPVCGVDLLPGRDGKVYVLEVNAVPGWRALAPVAQIDIAGLIVRYLVNEYRG